MIDLIKKTILAGVGATVVTKDKVESVLQDFVRQGKISGAEASTMADRISSEGRKEFESVSQDLGERIRELLSRANFVPKSQFDALEARVRLLEERSTQPPTRAGEP